MRFESIIKTLFAAICIMSAVLLSGCQEQVISNPVSGTKGDTAKETIPASGDIASDTTTPLPEKGKDFTVIAYYFHRTLRCPACLSIEANAGRVIKENFPQQIAHGSLMWLPFNLDDPGGEKLEKEFDISISTLLLAKMKDGNHTKYKKLEKVWDFIGDPVKFDNYVQHEVKQFLN